MTCSFCSFLFCVEKRDLKCDHVSLKKKKKCLIRRSQLLPSTWLHKAGIPEGMLSPPCCQRVCPVCSQQMFPISSGQQMKVGRWHVSVSRICTRGKFLLSLSLAHSGLSEGKKEEVRGILLGPKCHGLCWCCCSFSPCVTCLQQCLRGQVWFGVFFIPM